MDLERLKALIDLVSQSGLSELEITEGGERVRIAKPSASQVLTHEAPRTDVSTIVQSASRAPAKMPESVAERPREHIVASPMFGVFHRAPTPDLPPFVEPGHRVKPGQKLCIIEAMKSFNPICAVEDGTVIAILAENGQEVELGQPLFQINP